MYTLERADIAKHKLKLISYIFRKKKQKYNNKKKVKSSVSV